MIKEQPRNDISDMKNPLRIGNRSVKPGPNQEKLRYDRGKYRRSLAGAVIDACKGTTAVWCFRSKDADGPYYGLMCVSDR